MIDRLSYDEMDVSDTDRLPWEYWAKVQADRLAKLGFTDEWAEKMVDFFLWGLHHEIH